MRAIKLCFAVLAVMTLSKTLSAQSVPPYVPTNDLVGWWPFNSNANDESGHGHHGTVTGAQLSADRNGSVNSAYLFDGASNYIYVPSTNVTNVVKTTLSAWLKYMGNAGGLDYDTYWQFGERTQISSEHSMAYAYNTVGGHFNMYQPCKTSTFPAASLNNAWHHVVVIQDSNIMKVYVDTVLIDSVYDPQTVCYQGKNTIWIGASPSDNQFVTGNIDDIGFWTRPLTRQEIIDLYHATLVGVNEQTSQASYVLFPNPGSDKVNIRLNSSAISAFRITDNLGRTVCTGEIDKEAQIDISNLPDGTYFLLVNGVSHKLYKQRGF